MKKWTRRHGKVIGWFFFSYVEERWPFRLGFVTSWKRGNGNGLLWLHSLKYTDKRNGVFGNVGYLCRWGIKK